MRHIWTCKSLHLRVRLRLYVVSVCSILTYGSEAWNLDEATQRMLNGANSQMVAIITGKTPHEEASPSTRTFDLLRSIRVRRFRWLGHILRMSDEKLVHKAVHHLYHHPTEGNLLMDAPPPPADTNS